jgi:hypothetical protein
MDPAMDGSSHAQVDLARYTWYDEIKLFDGGLTHLGTQTAKLFSRA